MGSMCLADSPSKCGAQVSSFLLGSAPPRQSVEYAIGHDDGMWMVLEGVFGRFLSKERQMEVAHSLTSLPMRLGGVGLWSAARRQPLIAQQMRWTCFPTGSLLGQSRSWNSWQQNQWGTVDWRIRLEQPEFWIMLV